MNAENRNNGLINEWQASETARTSALSALVDGELTDTELSDLLESADSVEGLVDWSTYHLIGDVLRTGGAGLTMPRDRNLASRVCARLQDERPQPEQRVTEVIHVRGTAANASLFRWKLVAGLASLTAVAAVGWSVVGSGVVTGDDGRQLALSGPVPAATTAMQQVVVQTPQGPMTRDPRLEQLLAEHRQYGGMSAFQTPTGFLRNATYDTVPQR